MQKVYLLLRNNQQTGPHTLEELIQLKLKPFDLIWVEGKSCGWSYPSEIETLKSFVPVPPLHNQRRFAQQETTPVLTHQNQKIFVSLPINHSIGAPGVSSPADAIEKKAEELRQRIQSYAAGQPMQEDEIKTNYVRSLNDVEEDYTSWMYKNKTRKKRSVSKKHILLAGITAIGLTGGWMMATVVFKEPAMTPLHVVVKGDDSKESTVTSETTTSNNPVFTASTETVSQILLKEPVKKEQKKKEPVINKKTAATSTAAVPETTQQQTVPSPIEDKPPVTTEERTEPVIAEAPKEKKKTLKQLLGGLFKKNKQEQTAEEGTRPAGNSNTGRNSSRRNDITETSGVDLANEVDVKTNKNSDSWMMGVQGLKFTLYNRSSTLLTAAAVEVLYYSEQNSLLDKKTIQFSNVAAQKSQTVAAPDHRLADHVEYRIISATGAADAYAKQ